MLLSGIEAGSRGRPRPTVRPVVVRLRPLRSVHRHDPVSPPHRLRHDGRDSHCRARANRVAIRAQASRTSVSPEDPHDRLQHAGDARIELHEATTSDAPSDERAPTSSRLVVGLSCISAILLAVAAWSLMRSPGQAPRVVTRSLIPISADHRVGLNSNRSNAVAITPDGTKIAYAAEHEGNREVYIHYLDQLESTRIGEASTMPFFSPDRQWVGFRAREGVGLMKASVRGGPAVALDVHATDRGISWTESNELIFVRGFVGGLATVSESGGDTELLTEPGLSSGTMAHRFPEALPDGKTICIRPGPPIWSPGSSLDRPARPRLRRRTSPHRQRYERSL